MKNYPVTTIAKLLNLSERRVQQLAKDGIIPRADKGKYDLVNSVRGYVKYLYNRAFGQNNESIDSHAEKARLLKAQAAKAELELAVMQDKYMEVSEVEFLWSGMILAFRSKMLSLPTKLTPILAAAGNDFAKIERTLEHEINEALICLSKYRNDETEYNSGYQQQASAPAEAKSK